METSAGVVLYRYENLDNLFLLLKYPSGHWDFAKGHREMWETNKQAAVRELAEETGIKDIIFVKGFKKRIYYSYLSAGRMTKKQVIFFLGRTLEEDVRLSDEHLEYVWLNYEESLERVTFDNAKRILVSAHRFLNFMTK
ncbi:MAG: NUDIX domain-containing protein [Cenarchaeum sp. SB0665_bin_23]|nr:NUDIX domain-containing protein [Cenarchaeum sp. SB0667_bin_13]MXY61501.1 NUDIX domain-containing protein [Cenarchaeum sp. SB0665_bin_23]MXZ94153.1 NUDIX domain-containing protein [Cenarchaeum sp. SB0666_bin_15]MYB47651.1 NUDIX domain-containing protein [Cenarchaeum sp. SB0662_bin_33]MYC80265.1 NUDIX domain-containing protein [Cenarchaeum sp. SB0661_bin_35]MYD58457.1 NUDIX domain-containing protein [Cenarchaeum sp. SB0678_bin_8]MYG33681.1 NUDIX domain-containing protein [Cenarchaeum sp. SB